jgi:hypothetical protein
MLAADSDLDDPDEPPVNITPPAPTLVPPTRRSTRFQSQRTHLRLYKPSTMIETTHGPATYVDCGAAPTTTSSVEWHNVSFPTSDSPDLVYRLRRDQIWLPTDKPDRYDLDGQLRSTASLLEIHSIHHHRATTGSLDPTKARRRPRQFKFDKIDIHNISNLNANAVEADIGTQYHHTLHHPFRPLIARSEAKELQDMTHLPVCGPPQPCTPDITVIRLLWVYRVKPDTIGNVDQIKARLTMMGNLERNIGLTRLDATAPVARPITFRLLLCAVLYRPGARAHVSDVKQAYLTTKMERTVHIGHPPGYAFCWDSTFDCLSYRALPHGERAPRTCMPLLCALYGGMECGRLFFNRYVKFHAEFGFHQSVYDRCLLIYEDPDGSFIFICFHVDDGLVVQCGDALWARYLKAFKFTDTFQFTCSPFTRFLGIDATVDYTSRTISLSVELHIDKFLHAFGMSDANPAKTPLPANFTAPILADIPTDPAVIHALRNEHDMQSWCGFAQFIHQTGKPEIGLPLKILSSHQLAFGRKHITLAKHVLRYLRGVKADPLVLRAAPNAPPPALQIFTDASHAADPTHRRSISGVIIKFGGNTIFWLAHYQRIVSHSSCESELMALDKGATLGQLARRLVELLDFALPTPIPIFVDNRSTIDITSGNPIQQGRNLHIHARYFYVNDLVINKAYTILHLPTNLQVADLMCSYKGAPNFLLLRRYVLGCCMLVPHASSYTWDESLLN